MLFANIFLVFIKNQQKTIFDIKQKSTNEVDDISCIIINTILTHRALDHNLPEVHERVNILNRTSSTQTLSTEEIGMHELGRVEDQSPERVFGLMQEVYISRLEWSNQCLMKRIVFSVWSCLKSIVQDIWTGCKILLCCGCGGRLCTV